jgi:hypothetical protein
MLGVPQHQAEDALHSERAARAVISRRNLFAAGGALAAGAVWSFPGGGEVAADDGVWVFFHPSLETGVIGTVLGRMAAEWADRELVKLLREQALILGGQAW